MSEYMENSAMATGLENVSFHSNPKEKQCQRTFKLAYNAVHTAARLFSKYFKLGFSKASAVCELRTCRCTFWILKRQRNQRSNCQHLLDHTKSKRAPEKHLLLLYWLLQILWLCGSQKTVENSSSNGNTRPPDLPLEKPISRSGSNT